MNQQRDIDMSGALFECREKKSPKSPDRSGSITISGTKYRLSGWINIDKNGRRYLSLKASRDEQSVQREGTGQPAATQQDAVPF